MLRRVYCHAAVASGKVLRNVVAEWDDACPSGLVFHPFTMETPATEALDGIIVALPGDCLLREEDFRLDPYNFPESLENIRRRIPADSPPVRILMLKFR
jgi:hypothetical protein